MLGLVEPENQRVVDTNRVIVEVRAGAVTTVWAPRGMQVVVIDHDELSGQSDTVVEAMIDLTREIAWGSVHAYAYCEEMVLVGEARQEAGTVPPYPPVMPEGKAIVEMSDGQCVVVWTPLGVDKTFVDHDELSHERADANNVEACILDTPELPWGTSGYDYRVAMLVRKPFDRGANARRRPSGLAATP